MKRRRRHGKLTPSDVTQYTGIGLHDYRNIPLYAHLMGKPLLVFVKFLARRERDRVLFNLPV